MGWYYLQNAVVFLIDTAFGFYILALMLRFLLGLVRADFRNPFAQMLLRTTSGLLLPLRRIIPGSFGFDWANFLLMFVLQFMQNTLVAGIIGEPYSVVGTVVQSIAALLSILIRVFVFSIFLEIAMSWFQTGQNPLEALLYRLNYPLLNPLRKRLPLVSGIDFSPMVALVVLELFSLLLVLPLQDFGKFLSTG
ncbi:YggT family protein [Gammaproteobacteria bacterium]